MTSLRAFLGFYPKTENYETNRQKLEQEYKAILEFESSEELKRFNELDHYIHSNEFLQKKKDILSLRFQNTEDYHKEEEFYSLSKTSAIVLYYKVKDSDMLNAYYQTEKSEELKRYNKLEKEINTPEFIKVKVETSASAKVKFSRSDLAKTLHQYELQKKSDKIKGYYKFIKVKAFADFVTAENSGIIKKIDGLEKKINSKVFQEKISSLSKAEFKASPEKEVIDEHKNLQNSRVFKNYQMMSKSPYKRYFDELHNNKELKNFEDLKDFFTSKDYQTQKKDIEQKGFKDTPEYNKLQEYKQLAKSKQIKSYLKFKDSRAFKNYQGLEGSLRLQEYEKLKSYIKSDKFIQKKSYYTQSPKKRWKESKEYALITEFEQLQKNEKIKWYFKNRKAKRLEWFHKWQLTFVDDFATGKLDPKKWISRYFYGEALLKDSYSLSNDKHFMTDGNNLDFGTTTLRIHTKKETIKGKSWHPQYGFITREFGYTSGIVNTGKSFRQKYGTFEAKIKLGESKKIQNAFWMVSNTIIPHIDIANANRKVKFGNIWGNAKDLKSAGRFSKSVSRKRFTSDFYIYSLEWTPEKLTWRINGEEIASATLGVPQEPMYIVLSAGLHENLNTGLPSLMEIDWVRCYQNINF